MSFVNLYGNDVWSVQDINNRVQSMIRSKYSAEDELKASRLARKTDRSEEDELFIMSIDEWILQCLEEGKQAVVDNALLVEVIEYEAAERRLDQYELEKGTEDIPPITEFILDEEGNPTDEPNPEWVRVLVDREERAAAQAIVDAASADVVELYALRNPEPVEESVEESAPAVE